METKYEVNEAIFGRRVSFSVHQLLQATQSPSVWSGAESYDQVSEALCHDVYRKPGPLFNPGEYQVLLESH